MTDTTDDVESYYEAHSQIILMMLNEREIYDKIYDAWKNSIPNF